MHLHVWRLVIGALVHRRRRLRPRLRGDAVRSVPALRRQRQVPQAHRPRLASLQTLPAAAGTGCAGDGTSPTTCTAPATTPPAPATARPAHRTEAPMIPHPPRPPPAQRPAAPARVPRRGRPDRGPRHRPPPPPRHGPPGDRDRRRSTAHPRRPAGAADPPAPARLPARLRPRAGVQLRPGLDRRHDAPGGHNGCDTRDDVLRAQLADVRLPARLALRRDRRRAARPLHRADHRVRQGARGRGADRPHRAPRPGVGPRRQHLAPARADAFANDEHLVLLAVDGPSQREERPTPVRPTG